MRCARICPEAPAPEGARHLARIPDTVRARSRAERGAAGGRTVVEWAVIVADDGCIRRCSMLD